MEAGRIHKLKMTEEELGRFQALLMKKSGLVFEGRRLQEMEKAIARRIIELSQSSFEEYYRHLSGARSGDKELDRLVISLTVGETQFFRTPDQFAALRKYVLPELIQKKRSTEKKIKIVSAGCATGEEPYTLCIMLDDLLPDISSWDLDIIACDINKDFLKIARAGEYSERKLRLVDPETREKYFTRKSKNLYEIKDNLRGRVKLKHFNITTRDYSPITEGDRIDLLLCRNVLIYFDMDTIKRTINKFHKTITDDGYLMLGYSETLFKISEEFQSVHTPEAFFYKKTDKAVPSPSVDIAESETPKKREDFIHMLGSKPHPMASKDPAADSLNWFKRAAEALGRELPADKCEPMPPRKHKSAVPIFRPSESRDKPAPKPEVISEEQLWEEAIELFSKEKFEEARSMFERMLELNDCSARAHIGLGFLQANLGVDEQSRKHAEEALRHDDLLPEIYLLLALLEEKNENHEQAIANYQRVLLLSPGFAMAHFNLGNLFLKLKRYKDANREFGNALKAFESGMDNYSIRFSGGLSRDAAIAFCRTQQEYIAESLTGRAG